MKSPGGSWDLPDLNALQAWVEDFQSRLKGDEIVLLSGEMGAGKTEIVKRVCALYGVKDVASPTFAFHHAMKSPSGQAIDHFDLYRLESLDELETTGIWDLLQSPSLVLIEWPERVPDEYWPQKRVLWRVRIDKVPGPDFGRRVSATLRF